MLNVFEVRKSISEGILLSFFLRELKDFPVPAKLCPAVICRVTELFDCFLSSQLSSDLLTDAMFI